MSEVMEAAERAEQPQPEGPVEAVLISGARRGESVQIGPAQQETWGEQDLAVLHASLQELDGALIGLIGRARSLNGTLDQTIERL